MGIDGWLEFNDPLQVKQTEDVDRKVVDEFYSPIKSHYIIGQVLKEAKGLIVSFSFTKDAYEEIATAKNQDNIDIKLVTVQGVLVTS